MRVFIEAEAGSYEKGVFDEESLARKGTRRTLLPYPYPYGFVLGTRTEDGEALDCYIITDSRLAQGSIVECEPIGLLEMLEGDEVDHKVLAALPGSGAKADGALRDRLAAFITGIFKAYPDVHVEIGRLLGAEAAEELIARCRPRL